jgi:CheY-like chemotaxis protein
VHVLLVEDHADTRDVLVKLLRRWRHLVTEAGTVTTAVGLLRNLQFDVLLSDIGLPDGNGLEVLAEAQRCGSARLNVALTAHGNAADRERGVRAGFHHYLTKPFDAARLKTVIAHA